MCSYFVREALLNCKGILAKEIHAFKQQCDCFVTNHILINPSDPKEVTNYFRSESGNAVSSCKVYDPKIRTVNVKGNWEKALIGTVAVGHLLREGLFHTIRFVRVEVVDTD